MMWVAMIFNALLSWNLLLPIFTYCDVAQSVMVTGSNFDSTSTMNDVDNTQRKTQGLFTPICGLSTDRCLSVGHAITTSNGATTRQLHLTEIAEISYNVVGGETATNAQSPVMETLGRFSDVDVITATNKLKTVLTQVALNVSQTNTKVFTGYDSDITRRNEISTSFHEKSTNISRLLGNDSRILDSQSNVTHSVNVETRENTTILIVEKYYWQERLSVTLGAIVPPLLIIIGTLGNAVSVITFQNRHFRYSSTGFILSALSVVDIAVLNTFFMSQWLMAAFGIKIKNMSRFSCKWWAFSSYYLHHLASWTLILLTVERTIALWFPLRSKELCSKRRIVFTWIIFTIILLPPHTFIFLAIDLVPTTVGFDENNITRIEFSCNRINAHWSHLDNSTWRIYTIVIGDFIPFIAILIGNILTITRILKSQWERKTQMGAASGSKAIASTTAMLFGISAMFLILNLPIDIVFMYYATTDTNSLVKEEKAIFDLAYGVGIMFCNSNNAFEFIVYFVGGRKFRQAFLETFLPCRKTTNQNLQTTNAKRNRDTRGNSSEM